MIDETMTGVITDIISQHAEEAAFLWLLRSDAAYAPHYSLEDLAELDDRVEAHLDGLRIAGEAGWNACKEELAWEEAGEVFAASAVAMQSESDEWYYTVLEAASNTTEEARGFISALGWLSYERAKPYIERLLDAESAVLRYLGLAGSALHRQDPGPALARGLSASNDRLRTRALKAVGELGRRDLLRPLHAHLQTEDPNCQFYAAWSAARLGESRAVAALIEHVETESAYRERALDLALRRLPHQRALDIVHQLDAQQEHQRLAVKGAGAIGDPALIPWLIEKMAVPELARVAGESFSLITGVDIAYEDLEGEGPDGFEAGPTDDPEDENVDMDSDEDLPWPDPERIAAWYAQHRRAYRDGTRYFLGQPLSEPGLQEALRTATQRQRAAAALELGLLHPDQPLFEVRAPGFRQQQVLGL